MEGELVFKKKTPREKSKLETAIDEVFSEMQGFTADSDEYAKMADQLTKLYALKTCNEPDRVSKDTLAIVFGNIISIALIVGHERTSILTSKAVHLLHKLR